MPSILNYNYRIHLLLELARDFIPPLLIASVLLSFLPSLLSDGFFLRSLWRLLICLAYWTVNVKYADWKNHNEAKKMGVVYLPRLKGKWPGNLDIALSQAQLSEEGYVLENFERMFTSLGTGDEVTTFNLGTLWEDIYVTRDHRVMQTVLATSSDYFWKGPDLRIKTQGSFGDGIFVVDGAEAKAHRALTRPFFARERVQDFNIFGRYTEKVLAHLLARFNSSQAIDIQDIFSRFTMDAAGEFLFGSTTFNTLDLPLPPPNKKSKLGPKGTELEGSYGSFIYAFEKLQEITLIRNLRGPLKVWGLMEFWKDETKIHRLAVDAFIDPLIEDALKEKRKRGMKQCDPDEGNLVDHLVDMTSDLKLIRDELFNILTAARDTTAALLTFTTYLLCLHPDVMAILRKEVLTHVPNGPPTFDDVRKMRYLRAVLNETLRLFPPAPLNLRSSRLSTLLPADQTTNGKLIYIPGGTTVLFMPLLMQRRKDLWGSDADEFDPERWIDKERVKKMTDDPFMFLPFSTGPRICLGRNFAYNQASFIMIRILQTFDTFTLRQQEDAPDGSCPPASWRGAPGRKGIETIWPKMSISLFIKGGCWVHMSIADS
ncbi:cytochrome P450 monooxygenase CYP63 [Cantharellus anzutake]|uniref:cytochrome P450 monooxygenase CYP63 n=1 Tax=Cantharellus anzutake TaxID=1750568 RepID=UPI00190391C2|nr:cytochrome P450 monooxygenase CYP63 [Cantharellus anzutake]KAF8338717.1 cytochrome P450 monooxygenase CYP63 [Cantharellus anzutake]